MTSDINGAMLQHYQPSRLQLRLMRLGLRRFRWFRRWLGGVWRRTRGTWRHHLELTPMELMALFPMVAVAEIAATMPKKTAEATFGIGRDYELWSLPPGELPQARAIRIAAELDASPATSDGMPVAGPGKPAPR